MTDQRPSSPNTPASGDAALRQAGATPLQPGDPGLIGPYIPLGLLGRGGMGRVYLARPADGGAGLAAVKVIRPEYAEDPQFRKRFEREAAVHARILMPYAPQLLGTGFEDSVLWMATQFLPGLNLADAVRDCGSLDAAGMWRLVAELGKALEALAAAGIVHRDLKPSNVIVSLRGAHVIDFGISQAADSSAITMTGARVGTPAFMSPEYLREGSCDTASDVFSLACTLVYAATGNAPFGDGTGVDVMHRVAFEEPKPDVMAEVAEVDPALARLLSACLAKDPAGRPTPRQLTDAAATSGHDRAPSWQEPLGAHLLARRQGYEEVERTSAEQGGHFRSPPVAYPTPAPPERSGSVAQHDTVAGGDRHKRWKPYAAFTAGLAVCAVVVSAFLLTRPAPADTAATTPAAATTAPGDQGPAFPPAPSGPPSPSASATKSAKDKDKDNDEAAGNGQGTNGGSAGSGAGSGGGAQATPDDPETPAAGGGGGGTATSAAPTKTVTAAPATPAWISQCTYYSGTELTDYGDTGQRVVQVQCMLTKRGYSVGSSGVDGDFGKDTDAAVRNFQSDKGLEVDGQVGPNTWAALRSST